MWSKSLVLAALALVAVGAPATAATVRITVTELTYEPAQVSAKVGDAIEWGELGLPRSLRDRPQKRCGTCSLRRARPMHVTPTQPGEIDYYCRFHPNMVGHISVAAP